MTDNPAARCGCCDIDGALCAGLVERGMARCCSDCTHVAAVAFSYRGGVMNDDLAEALFAELARRNERLETAVQVLHSRRHRLGWGRECGRCRADVAAVARALLGG